MAIFWDFYCNACEVGRIPCRINPLPLGLTTIATQRDEHSFIVGTRGNEVAHRVGGISECVPDALEPRRIVGQCGRCERERFLLLFETKEEGPPTEFTHGVAQALVLMNQTQFNTGAALIDRLMKSERDAPAVIEALYLATLSRPPTAEELKLSLAFVARKRTPQEGYNGVLWSLINRGEFILNH